MAKQLVFAWCACINRVYHPLLVGVVHAVLSPHAVNIPPRLLKNTDLYMVYGWVYAESVVVTLVGGVDTTLCLDFFCVCDKITGENIPKIIKD